MMVVFTIGCLRLVRSALGLKTSRGGSRRAIHKRCVEASQAIFARARLNAGKHQKFDSLQAFFERVAWILAVEEAIFKYAQVVVRLNRAASGRVCA